MSYEDITIYRAVPLKNNYLQLPSRKSTPNNLSQVTALNEAQTNPALIGSALLDFNKGGSCSYLYGAQRIFQLPGVNARDWYSRDPVAALNALV